VHVSKRVRAKARAPPRGGLQPQVEQRLADADYDAQQTQARTEALLRKEIANAEADAEARRKAASSEPASGSGPKTRGGKRRESTVGSAGKTSRRGLCGKSECGWVPTAPGRHCNRCPKGRVHEAEARLCTACHQPADENGFTHLKVGHIASASSLLGDLTKAESGEISTMLCTYHPEHGQCLCWRDGCLISLLGLKGNKEKEKEKEEAEPGCQGCPYKPPPNGGGRKSQRRMYTVAGNEGCGGAGASTRGAGVLCQACFSKRRRSSSTRAPGGGGSGVAETSTSSQAPANGGADEAGKGASTGEDSGITTAQARVRKVKAASVVRSRVERSVNGGEVVYWKDVAEWLTVERARLGEDKLKDGSAREKVKQMFDSIVARSPGCNARVVDIRGNRVAGGSGREKALCLFPKDVRDDVVVGYLVRMRDAEGATLKSELGRVARDPTGPPDPVFTEERMEVVKTAGEIVRRDIELEKSLKNVPPPGQGNNYMKEVERVVETYVRGVLPELDGQGFECRAEPCREAAEGRTAV